ncbi:MAG: sulfotransferase domain-containing protein [Anaerolineales bacterium]
MIVLAAGMPRAGSGWHYNLVHDLVVAAGGQDARIIRKRFFLAPILTKVNCNIRVLSTKRLAPVLVPSMLGNTFAIKTHSGPTPIALRLIQTGRMRVTYIYRDPRAALLSAYEYGERAREAGRMNTFARLDTIPKAIDFVLVYLRIGLAWMSVKGIHTLKYESLLESYDEEAHRLAAFLKADPSMPAVVEAINFYRSDGAKQAKGQHYRHGEADRFREELNPPDLEAANTTFEPFLREMHYEI